MGLDRPSRDFASIDRRYDNHNGLDRGIGNQFARGAVQVNSVCTGKIERLIGISSAYGCQHGLREVLDNVPGIAHAVPADADQSDTDGSVHESRPFRSTLGRADARVNEFVSISLR